MEGILRQCWQLDGTVSAFDHCVMVLSQEDEVIRIGPETQGLSDVGQREYDGRRMEGFQCNAEVDAWHDLCAQLPKGRMRIPVESWYLRVVDFEVCSDSRVVYCSHGMSMVDFLKECRDVWHDRAVPEEIKLTIVRDAPTTSVAVKAHVILSQRSDESHSMQLVHWDQWPILRKFRAVMFNRLSTVHQVLDKVRFDGRRLPVHTQYGMHFGVGLHAVHLGHDDILNAPSASVVYGYPVHVPQDNSSQSELGSVSTAISTNALQANDSDIESDAVTWMSTGGIISMFDQQGPYPWEVDSPIPDEDDEIEEEESMLEAEFDDAHRRFMHQHASFLRAHTMNDPSSWVAVTFGVGLVSLGRRDLEFSFEDLDDLPLRIVELWSDHAHHGQTSLHFVTPQPEGMHIQRYLVFIFAVDYNDQVLHDEKKVLVRERSPDDEMITAHPYAAILPGYVSPGAVLAQLSHKECCPMGIRLCHVRLAGRWLHSQEEYFVLNGDLCDLVVSEYPHFVDEADNSVGNAERLFQIARASFDSIPGSVRFTLRVHGVSPRNRPLGFRDIYVDYPDLLNLNWTPQMRALWPFQDSTAACWFVPSADSSLGDWTDKPILHFVLSYVDDMDGCPILVRQEIYEVHTQQTQQDMQAVVVPRDADESALRQTLNRSPFWFLDGVRTHMYREGRKVEQVVGGWSPADILDLRVNVLSMEKLLYFLWHIHQVADNSLELEDVSMLQLASHLVKGPDLDEDEVADVAFQEICIACRQQFNETLCGQEDQEVTAADSSYAKPEDNSGLRKASCPKKISQSSKQMTCSTDCDEERSEVLRISLEHTLMAPPRELDLNHQMLGWFDNDSWWDVFKVPWPYPLGALPEGVNIHPATWEALHCQAWHSESQIDQIELYVDGATSDGSAGWAVVVVSHSDAGQMLQGVLSGQVVTNPNDPAWLGAHGITNITAEVTSLIVAQMLAHSLQGIPHIQIRPDLQLSKKLTDLEVVLATAPIMASICACFTRFHDARICTTEVRAHKQHPWNELADCIAKHAARGGQTTGTVPWDRIAPLIRSRQDREWAWLQTADQTLQQTLPPVFENTVMQVAMPDVPDTVEVQEPHAPSEDAVMDLQICSLNTLSLDSEPTTGEGTRALRLDQQMHERGVVIVGLQETRTQQGRRISDHYHIFSSGGSGLKGKQHFGCEIWIHRTLPVLVAGDGEKYLFQDFKAVVAAADERRLIMKLSGPATLVIAALHAPCRSSQTSLEEIEEWWKQTVCQLEKVRSTIIIACCDANAPLGESGSDQHGTVGAEPTNAQSELFENFLADAGLIAPSTYQCHRGELSTWRHPKGSFHRRDYILVSRPLLASVRLSQVWQDVDLGFAHIDHYPVACRIVSAIDVGKKRQKIRWDRTKFRDPVACANFQKETADLPMPRWDVWVDAHNKYFNENVLRIATKHFAKAGPSATHRPMLSEPTKNLIAFKRQVLRWMRHATNDEYEEIKLELKLIEKQLRKMVWNDQRAWYDDWIAQLDLQAQQHNSGEVYRMLQRLGKRKKSNGTGPRPLPMIRDENGVHAANHDEMISIWTNQFARQEAGLKIQTDELVDLHLDGPTLDPTDLDPNMVPSLQQINMLVRKLKNGRAPGPNKILPEILKAGGDQICVHLLPLVSKAILHTREPLEWKSGTLVPLFKGRGSPAEASAYRSIYVADCTGKLHHGWVRQFLEEQWLANQGSIQLGGRKGVGTDIARHVIQSLLAWTKQCALATSILFLDLRAAFYSVHRGALFEGPVNDKLLVLAMQHHGILPDDWDEIRAQLERDNATAGISKHASVVLADMFSGTHFRLAGGKDNVLTCRGTRPGDPVGDLLFNMLFAIVSPGSSSCRQRHFNGLDSPKQWAISVHCLPCLIEAI